MALVSTLLALAGFQYLERKDPFTDEITWVAAMESGRGRVSLSVECGADTGGELMVRIIPGKSLWSSRYSSTPSLPHRVRFDGQEPVEMRFHYRDDTVFLTGDDARSFAENLARSEKVVFELSDWNSRKFSMEVPTTTAAESVSKVTSYCAGSIIKQ